eukprot:COSAG02_NODE_39029_length_421_cov_255.531056_1_plen_40_part_01
MEYLEDARSTETSGVSRCLSADGLFASTQLGLSSKSLVPV